MWVSRCGVRECVHVFARVCACVRVCVVAYEGACVFVCGRMGVGACVCVCMCVC